MKERQRQLAEYVNRQRDLIEHAERWLWAHPQTGYTEWEAHGYLKEKFETLGYNLIFAGNIPGFYTDIDTGLPGPKLCIMAELDALDLANHPEAVNGIAHACGHHGQGAALLGIAAALKESGALDGLSGSIRLMVVPAEEMIQLGFREELRKKKIIKYMGGKTEFMARGYLDDVDLALMVHGAIDNPQKRMSFSCARGHVGCMAKTFTYRGKAAHAGGAAFQGINAQYAAMLGLQACNALRETFQEKDYIRFHPIMKGVNCAVNIIPDEMPVESYVRAKTLEAMKQENVKINRALTGAALAMGARVEINDRPGYFPEYHDREFMELVEQCCADLVGAEQVLFHYEGWSTGSSDFGDITAVIPGVQINAIGAEGTAHGVDFKVTDVERLCVNSAKVQLFVAYELLINDAQKAKGIIEHYHPTYPSIKAYFDAIDELFLDTDAVVYDEDGNVKINDRKSK